MAEAGDPSGAMASIHAGYAEVLKRLNGDALVIAARNGPLQTVVSGEAGAVRRFTEKLRSQGVTATMLSVSHAFHSPLVGEVATAFSAHLSSQSFANLERRVISTVTAAPLAADADLKSLLSAQITKPVLFAEALNLAAPERSTSFWKLVPAPCSRELFESLLANRSLRWMPAANRCMVFFLLWHVHLLWAQRFKLSRSIKNALAGRST